MQDDGRLQSEVDRFVARTWDEVEAFLDEGGVGASVLSREVANDPNLIRQIRQGRRRLTFAMAQRLSRYLAAQGGHAA